jgi:hypothetical protein
MLNIICRIINRKPLEIVENGNDFIHAYIIQALIIKKKISVNMFTTVLNCPQNNNRLNKYIDDRIVKLK